MCRRLTTLLAMVVMMTVMVGIAPALSIPPPTTPGQFTCLLFDPDTDEETVVNRVPRGQVAIYEAAGYLCFRSGQFG